MKRVSVLFAALFCAALPAQEAGVQTDGQPALAPLPAQLRPANVNAAVPPPAAPAPVPAPLQPAGVNAAVPPPAAPAPVPAPLQPAGVNAVVPPPAAPAPVPAPLRPADVNAAVPPPAAPEQGPVEPEFQTYRSARDAIIAVNRKFPRPPRRLGQAGDTARAPRQPDSALASADEALRAAWAAMGVHKPPRARDTAKTAALPCAAYLQVPKGEPAAKPYAAQTALGVIVPLGIGKGERVFKPWWDMGYHLSYREIDADALFSGGLGVDLSIYTFSKKEYNKYYKSDRSAISLSGVTPLVVVDLDYYMKLYLSGQYKIPYIAGGAGICGAFGGSAKASYKTKNLTVSGADEDLLNDVYVFHAAAGVGVDVPVYAGIKVFAEVQYALRLGLYSMFDGDGRYSGGMVPQAPVRFGVMAPFKAIAGLF